LESARAAWVAPDCGAGGTEGVFEEHAVIVAAASTIRVSEALFTTATSEATS
jgi:hypothetical protein